MDILYIHGMGGGADSRIPSILKERLAVLAPALRVTVRTYDFAPDIACGQIAAWVEELKPGLVIGESMGAIHALAVSGVPHLLVSPSLNAPIFFSILQWLVLIPGVTALCDRIWKPKEGERQPLHFDWRHLHAWKGFRRRALAHSPKCGGKDSFFAFFGTRDHYRRSGIVRVRTWRKYYGDTFRIYDGTHFMEEEYIDSLLVPKILEITDNITCP